MPEYIIAVILDCRIQFQKGNLKQAAKPDFSTYPSGLSVELQAT